MANAEESLTTGDFQIDRQSYRVTLNKDLLKWEAQNHSSRRLVNQVKITDIITVEPEKENDRAFTVHFVTCQCKLSPRRRNNAHRWRKHEETLVCKNKETAQKWIDEITKIIKGLGRPEKIIVIVNESSGKRKGTEIYKEVETIFDLAKIKVELADDIENLNKVKNLNDFDGIVCVGGDGTFKKIVDNLLRWTQQDAGIDYNDQRSKLIPPKLNIGIIPAGSTDVVVYNTIGYRDPETSALQIVLGEKLGMDVCSVFCNGELKHYAISFLGYGFFGDTVKMSENCLRYCRSKNYCLAGTFTCFRNKSYQGKVEYVESGDTSKLLTNETTCFAGCRVCSQSSLDVNNQQAVKKPGKENWITTEGKYRYVNAALVGGICKKAPTGVSPTAHLGNGYVDLIMVKCSCFNYLRYLCRMGSSKNHLDFNFVEVKRVKKFKFQPPGPSCWTCQSVWNIDGEVLENPSIDVNVHCQLINVFARGIEPTCTFSS